MPASFVMKSVGGMERVKEGGSNEKVNPDCGRCERFAAIGLLDL